MVKIEKNQYQEKDGEQEKCNEAIAIGQRDGEN